MKVSKQAIIEALKSVQEPDLKRDIVSLNLVNIVSVDNRSIKIQVKVSNPAMHQKNRMREACEFALKRTIGDEFAVEVEVVALNADERTGELRKVFPGVKKLIAVASGKGGVGKSTVSANLAAGLAARGYSVGMLDADIYGPSAPTMMGLTMERPRVVEVEGKSVLEPVTQFGVRVMSIGFFSDINQAVVWRGPMASKALSQMIHDVVWGQLDYLIIDLPPGTGDVHLSIVQSVPLDAVVIVSTPQEVALADARRGVAMFQLPAVNVPVLGIIENMSWFTPAELPVAKYYLFGKDGAKNLADDLKLPFLGHLPLYQSIREAGDAGIPAVLQNGTAVEESFNLILNNFERELRLLPFRKS